MLSSLRLTSFDRCQCTILWSITEIQQHGFLSSRCDTRCRGHTDGTLVSWRSSNGQSATKSATPVSKHGGRPVRYGTFNRPSRRIRAASSCSHVHTSTGVRAHVRVRESKIDCGGANLWKMDARGSGINRLSSGAGCANSKGPPQPVPSDVARRHIARNASSRVYKSLTFHFVHVRYRGIELCLVTLPKSRGQPQGGGAISLLLLLPTIAPTRQARCSSSSMAHRRRFGSACLRVFSAPLVHLDIMLAMRFMPGGKFSP